MHTPKFFALASLLSLAFATAFVPAQAAEGERRVADTFGNGTSSGVPLHARRLTPGPGTWDASRNLSVFRGSDGGFVGVDTLAPFIARVPVPPGGKTLVVEGALRVSAGNERGGWVAIGFGEPEVNPVQMTWAAGVFVLLNPRGEYECHYNPGHAGASLQRIRSGRITNFDPSLPTPVVLRLNRDNLTLDVEVNGTAVIQRYELANVTNSVATTFAGFSGFEQKPGAPLVSSFSASVLR